MKYFVAILKALIFGAIGFGVGFAVYNGLCNFFSGVWEEGPELIIYAPIYIPTVIGVLGGFLSGISKMGGCATIFAIVAVVIALLVLLVLALIIGGIIEQDAYWLILLVAGLFGGGYVVIRFFFD